MREIAVSGVRPTGKQHLGNYLGAVVNFVRMQEEYDGYFFIADLHSLTTHPRAADLQANVRQTLIEYLACGLDPDKCTLFVQSQVPQISELYLIFNMFAYDGELHKVPTFKDKVRTQPDNVNAGLLTYPVLMAVDILIHHASKVPVGKDQMQHIEMTRNFGNRFNHTYGVEYFKEPIGFNYGDVPLSVPSLDGEGKMSKSKGENTVIYLMDEPEVILKKIKRAKTESDLISLAPDERERIERSANPVAETQKWMTESIRNIFDLMALVSSPEVYLHYLDQFRKGTLRFGEMKPQIAEDMTIFLAPIRERIREISADQAYLTRVMEEGGEKARASAQKTVTEVREIIGLKSR
ncbi:MAG: tryptophan--tRNA ligase [Bacteroidetes bacterium]|nr:tryptophan--tRNA ligase [Bacteroidota bacterium]